jgi:hypothetical protein
MSCVEMEASDALLARINRQLQLISERQHRLARRRALLQEQATRLRLGESPALVYLTLRAAGRKAKGEIAEVRPTASVRNALVMAEEAASQGTIHWLSS